jgi:hypothetical protein
MTRLGTGPFPLLTRNRAPQVTPQLGSQPRPRHHGPVLGRSQVVQHETTKDDPQHHHHLDHTSCGHHGGLRSKNENDLVRLRPPPGTPVRCPSEEPDIDWVVSSFRHVHTHCGGEQDSQPGPWGARVSVHVQGSEVKGDCVHHCDAFLGLQNLERVVCESGQQGNCPLALAWTRTYTHT